MTCLITFCSVMCLFVGDYTVAIFSLMKVQSQEENSSVPVLHKALMKAYLHVFPNCTGTNKLQLPNKHYK